MPYFTSADIDQYYEVHGQGQPVVLVAGYTCDHTFWSGVCQALQPHRQVVVFDNRAVGRSKDGGGPVSIDTLAGDTAALIRHLGLTKPTVVGQSMGGAIVQAMRARFASACGPSVIVNSTRLFSPKARLALRSALELRQAGVDIDLIIDTVLPWVAGSAWLAAPGNIEAFKTAVKSSPAPQTVSDQARQLAAIEGFDGRALDISHAPTLVISSTDDALTPVDEGRQLARHLDAAFVEIEGGHGSALEQPARLAELILAFSGR